MKTFAILAFALFLAHTASAATVKRLSHDFYTVEEAGNGSNGGLAKLMPAMNRLDAPKPDPTSPDFRAQCEAHLKAALCVTNRTASEIGTNWQKVRCEEHSDAYLPQVMELFDEMPARMQPLYCTLSRIFLSDRIESTAFASTVTRHGKVVGAYIGARKASFGQGITAASLISWKEQLLFGGSTDFLANDPSLVQINYNLRMSHTRMEALFYVIMHELGHVVDFENDVNAKPRKYGWEALSWTSYSAPKRDARYAHQDEICYYGCSSHINPKHALEMYNSLKQSAFPTSYSGMNEMEDFAEFWAWNIMLQFKDPDYRIQIPGQGEVDMTPAFTENEKVKRKMDLIRELWDSPETKIGF